MDTDESMVRTITQASPGSHTGRRGHGLHVQVHEPTDSILSETERRIIDALDGGRGEILRRTLINYRTALQRARSDADGVAASVRLDVQEYIGILEARFAAEFREVGELLGRMIRKGIQRNTGVRFRG